MVDSEIDSLRQSLVRLRAELASASRLDEKSRQNLRNALAAVETRLLKKESAAAEEAAAPHGLESLAVGFEADHPSLAASLRQFIELLGQAGL